MHYNFSNYFLRTASRDIQVGSKVLILNGKGKRHDLKSCRFPFLLFQFQSSDLADCNTQRNCDEHIRQGVADHNIYPHQHSIDNKSEQPDH